MNAYPNSPLAGGSKKSLSPIAFISMAGAIIFAIATFCMSFLPAIKAEISIPQLDQYKTTASTMGIQIPEIKSENTLMDYTSFGDVKKHMNSEYIYQKYTSLSQNVSSLNSSSIMKLLGDKELFEDVTDLWFGASAGIYDKNAIMDGAKILSQSSTKSSGSPNLGRYGSAMGSTYGLDSSLLTGSNNTEQQTKFTALKLNTQKGDTFTLISTILFFALIGVALFVTVGKALSVTSGGRMMALIFAVIGFLATAGYLIFVIMMVNKANSANLYSDMLRLYGMSEDAIQKSLQETTINVKSSIGIGLILQTAFSFVTLVFCCLGLSEKSAIVYKTPRMAAPAPQPISPAPFQPSMPSAPVPPAAPVTPVPQPAQGFNPPVPPMAPPESPSMFTPEKDEDDSPTVPQSGMIEGIKGEYTGASIGMRPGEKLIIGRDSSVSNIVLAPENKDVSRSHCSVKYDPYTNCYKVIDTSSNGTFVNGQQLPANQEIQLPKGTVISLGRGNNQFVLK